MPPVPSHPAIDDELVEELPPLPLDGDGDDGAEDDETFAEELDSLPDDGDLMDDATGEGDPVSAEWLEGLPAAVPMAAGKATMSALEDAESEDGLDVGDETFDVGEGGWLEPGATDMPDVPDEDPELDEGAPMGADAGEEGPLEEGEALDENALPELDADDGGEGEDAHFFDALAAEEAPLPWSAHRWDPIPVVSHFDVGHVISVAPASRGAVCLGKRLFRAELDGAVVNLEAAGLPDHARAIASAGDALFATTDRGVYRSDDGGASFAATDKAPGDLDAATLARVDRALALPRGFELAAAAERDDSALAVVRALSQGRLYVVEVFQRAGASPAIVAELAEPELEETDMTGGPTADRLTASWDAARSLFWIGGPFGVIALQPGSFAQKS